MLYPSQLVRAVIAAVTGIWLIPQLAMAQGVPEPTEHHKILKNDVGAWDAECQLWIKPDAKPIFFKAIEKNRMLKGDMWLISEFTGVFGSETFEGHSVIGYDPYQKKYVGGWVDSMNPYPSVMEGTYDAETKTMTMYSETRNPENGEIFKSKNITRYTGNDTRTFEMYMIENGSEWKMMEGKYTRKKQ